MYEVPTTIRVWMGCGAEENSRIPISTEFLRKKFIFFGNRCARDLEQQHKKRFTEQCDGLVRRTRLPISVGAIALSITAELC